MQNWQHYALFVPAIFDGIGRLRIRPRVNRQVNPIRTAVPQGTAFRPSSRKARKKKRRKEAAFVQYQQDAFDVNRTDDGTVCALRYEEFTALNTAMIQKQQTELDALRKEIAELKSMLSASKE